MGRALARRRDQSVRMDHRGGRRGDSAHGYCDEPQGGVPVHQADDREPVRQPGRRVTGHRYRDGASLARARRPVGLSVGLRRRRRAGRSVLTHRLPSFRGGRARDRPNAGAHRDHHRRLQLRRALQLLPHDAEDVGSSTRPHQARGADGDRRAVVLRRAGQQLPHAFHRGDGVAPARERRSRIHPRRRRDDDQASRAGARCRAAPRRGMPATRWHRRDRAGRDRHRRRLRRRRHHRDLQRLVRSRRRHPTTAS